MILKFSPHHHLLPSRIPESPSAHPPTCPLLLLLFLVSVFSFLLLPHSRLSPDHSLRPPPVLPCPRSKSSKFPLTPFPPPRSRSSLFPSIHPHILGSIATGSHSRIYCYQDPCQERIYAVNKQRRGDTKYSSLPPRGKHPGQVQGFFMAPISRLCLL